METKLRVELIPDFINTPLKTRQITYPLPQDYSQEIKLQGFLNNECVIKWIRFT
jgi:hypothetical protein